MQIYFFIVEVVVNGVMLVSFGGIVGLMLGLFGVGGGFLIMFLLFFIGIFLVIVVVIGVNQVVVLFFFGVLVYVKCKMVDFCMGWVLLVGGLVGLFFGVILFNML